MAVKVGSSVAVFIDKKYVHQLKYKLYKDCSNYQAEQLALIKTLEKLNNEIIIYIIYTDSKMFIDSVRTDKPQILNRKHV